MSDTLAVHTQIKDKGPDRIGWSGPTIGICITVACATIFNFFPEKVGYYKTIVDSASFVPLLGPGFATYLPWLNLWWGLVFSLQVAHLSLGRWITVTRWSDLGLDVLGAAVLLATAGGQPFLQVPVATFVARLVLIMTGCALLLGALGKFVRLLRRLSERA